MKEKLIEAKNKVKGSWDGLKPIYRYGIIAFVVIILLLIGYFVWRYIKKRKEQKSIGV